MRKVILGLLVVVLVLLSLGCSSVIPKEATEVVTSAVSSGGEVPLELRTAEGSAYNKFLGSTNTLGIFPSTVWVHNFAPGKTADGCMAIRNSYSSGIWVDLICSTIPSKGDDGICPIGLPVISSWVTLPEPRFYLEPGEYRVVFNNLTMPDSGIPPCGAWKFMIEARRDSQVGPAPAQRWVVEMR